MPNTTSTPTRSMAKTRACAPVTLTATAACRVAGCEVCEVCEVAGCDAPAGCAVAAGRGGAGLAAAPLAGMSSGDGACALGGTGLVCSVIGWLPCHNVTMCGDCYLLSSEALKNPSC